RRAGKTSAGAGDIAGHLRVAPGAEAHVAPAGDVVRAANAGVGHNRRAAARFPGGRVVAAGRGAIAERAVEAVIGPKLVAKLMHPDAERRVVANRPADERRPASFDRPEVAEIGVVADHADEGDA